MPQQPRAVHGCSQPLRACVNPRKTARCSLDMSLYRPFQTAFGSPQPEPLPEKPAPVPAATPEVNPAKQVRRGSSNVLILDQVMATQSPFNASCHIAYQPPLCCCLRHPAAELHQPEPRHALHAAHGWRGRQRGREYVAARRGGCGGGANGRGQ